MNAAGESASRQAVLLFTTFPVLSETFLQREVRGLQQEQRPLQLVSLWRGEARFEGQAVETNGLAGALAGLLWLPYWLLRRPRVTLGLLGQLLLPRSSGWLNWAENLLGASYGLRRARRWERSGPLHFHAVWASAPAMAGMVLHELTGNPFSFAGHAYDLFEKGGDGWIRAKAGRAAFVRTSTRAGQARLAELGVPEEKILLVRRGLTELPPFPEARPIGSPVRLLSVGRMVEKMGFDRQIDLFRGLREAGLRFEVEWVGDGPERPRLEEAVRQAGLDGMVRFLGRRPYSEVEQAYRRNDLFLFTGRVDRRGDRAGLPNAIAEAMAWGLPVFATRVGGVEEAVSHGRTGYLWEDRPRAGLVLEALADTDSLLACRAGAREWIEANFYLGKNLGPLCARLFL